MLTGCTESAVTYPRYSESVVKSTKVRRNHQTALQPKERLDRYEALEAEEDVHVLTGALKLFFRELAEPIFPKELNKEFMGAIRKFVENGSAKINRFCAMRPIVPGEPNSRQRFKAIDELLQKLPDANKATLRVLFSHLERYTVCTNNCG